jgi:hypothetical protein
MDVTKIKRVSSSVMVNVHQVRLADLWRRFHLHGGSQTVTEAFVKNLTEMVQRETSNTNVDRVCQARWDQSWATPDTLYAILAAGGVTVEWFCSPLNYSLCMQRHFSASPKDDVWGLEYDAYHEWISNRKTKRRWAEITSTCMSTVDGQMYEVHMGVANPPYLKEDLEKVCEYAWEACTATHPVRIWSVLPAHCKAMPNMMQYIQDKGGEIVALWPTHSFVFVPLDFWLGRSAFKVSRAMTAPFPVVLAVFENTLAQQLLPVTEEQIYMLQG